jgi:hypothetical protein
VRAIAYCNDDNLNVATIIVNQAGAAEKPSISLACFGGDVLTLHIHSSSLPHKGSTIPIIRVKFTHSMVFLEDNCAVRRRFFLNQSHSSISSLITSFPVHDFTQLQGASQAIAHSSARDGLAQEKMSEGFSPDPTRMCSIHKGTWKHNYICHSSLNGHPKQLIQGRFSLY